MGERGRERRRREARNRLRAKVWARRPVQWREFRTYDGAAVEWIKAGNVALTPGMVEKIGGGFSMYVHAGDPETFAAAARSIDCDPASVPAGRTGANLNGEFLLRAIALCRRYCLDDEQEPWKTACPECGAPFDRVADHTFGPTGETTTASCARGHRWRV